MLHDVTAQTKLAQGTLYTASQMQDDEAAKEAIDKYLRDNYNDILASLNTAINNEVGSTGSTVTSAGDLEVAAGSNATAIRLTGMAVLGAFLCAGLVI